MQSEPAPERLKVLYVEDDPACMLLVHRLLESEGFQVVTTSDGLSATEFAMYEKPNLILMDINIGGLDGYEVTTRLRSMSELDSTPIVAVTAATLDGDRERALAAGCNGYISKPIDVDTFPEQVREFLKGRSEEIGSAEERARHLVEHSRRLVTRLEEKVRELESANAELQRIDKMKSDFIVLAGHELRTPLTSIYGYTQMLLYSPDITGDPEEEGSPRSMLMRICDAVQRLNLVFDEIRNVSLIDANRLELAWETVMIEPLVHRAVDNLLDVGPARDLAFVYEGLEDLPMIEGDSQRVYHALWSIISNAIKYTPDGGHITISGRYIEDESMVHISIKDTGVGIPTEELERIFERFYVLEDTQLHHTSKTALKGGGLGLGLTVTRGIIEAHGGRVWAESEGYDEERLPGSTFHILLPLRRPDSLIQ
ncbi:MAG: hybrid sensor histidine kinase/response regulator [Anaerolineae bacterium]|nr:hybrid sensor histidine kinase/response regulator [Anaerolineae bacterium]